MIIAHLQPSLLLSAVARITVLLIGLGLLPKRGAPPSANVQDLPLRRPVPFFGD